MIEAIVRLLTELGKFANTQASTARARKILDLENQRNQEVAKGQNSDDALIESLEAEIKLNKEALINEILTRQA